MRSQKTTEKDLSDENYVTLMSALWAIDGYPVDVEAANRTWSNIKSFVTPNLLERTDI